MSWVVVMHNLWFLIGAVALIASTATATSGSTVSDAVTGATISAPLSVANVTPLYFGTFHPSQDETVKISVKSDNVDCNHPEILLSDDQTPAEFQVTGRVGAIYTVEVPDHVVLTSASGAPLQADLISVGPGHLEDGEDTIVIGSTMMIPPQQATDIYTGSFVITVAYQ